MLTACESSTATDAAVDEIFSQYVAHVTKLNGGINVAARGNMNELPRTEGQRGEEYAVEEWQSTYLGRTELVCEKQADGSLLKVERSRSGLEPRTEREIALPSELRVSEDAIQQAIDGEAAAIIEDTMRESAGLPQAQQRSGIAKWFACPDGLCTLVDCVPKMAGAFWRTGGSAAGYTEIGNAKLAADAVLRLFLRSDEVEVSGGVCDTNGVKIECDVAEKKVLKGGDAPSWWVRWICLCLHARHHFTHAVATDASHLKCLKTG